VLVHRALNVDIHRRGGLVKNNVGGVVKEDAAETQPPEGEGEKKSEGHKRNENIFVRGGKGGGVLLLARGEDGAPIDDAVGAVGWEEMGEADVGEHFDEVGEGGEGVVVGVGDQLLESPLFQSAKRGGGVQERRRGAAVGKGFFLLAGLRRRLGG
jgi:hypothetical protein